MTVDEMRAWLEEQPGEAEVEVYTSGTSVCIWTSVFQIRAAYVAEYQAERAEARTIEEEAEP